MIFRRRIMAKAVFKHRAILNPKYNTGYIRGNQLKSLKIYNDHLKLGREKIFYNEITEKNFENGVIKFLVGGKEILFAAQGISVKLPDPILTNFVFELIESVISKDETEIKKILFAIYKARSIFRISVTFSLISIICVCAAFGIMTDRKMLSNPALYLFFPLFFIFSWKISINLAKGIVESRKRDL
jgi:hypothetical protein